MNETYFRIAGIQKKIDSNQNLRTIMKGLGILIIFGIFFCSLNQPDTMRVAWILSVLFIFLLFFLEAYCIKQNKKYEFELYRLEVDELERKKRISDITGVILPDFILNCKIKMPSNEHSLPILYYLIILTLDVLIKVLMIH